jgi:exonuclease VII large subunit
MSNPIEKIATDLAAVGQAVARLIESVDARFDRVDQRLDRVDQRLDQVDQRLDQADSRFDQVDSRFDQVDRRFEQVDAAFLEQRHYTEFAYQRLDAKMDAGFARVERKLDQFIDTQGKTNELVERRLRALESADRRPKRR